MTCDACDNAERHPASAQFEPGCDSCAARAIATTSVFHDSIAATVKSPQYRMALAQFFPGREPHGDALAKQWLDRLVKAKRAREAA